MAGDAMRWDEWKAAQKGLHRGSSLEVFQQFSTRLAGRS
jgi:hypothetical protein